MKLFSKNETNTGRQFEFDLAKAICIFGMVFVHCFEEFPVAFSADGSLLYYALVIVLDAIFGAGTFMTCMGVGISYSKNNDPTSLMKRGITIFILSFILNIARFTIPGLIYLFGDDFDYALTYLVGVTVCCDIMQFAGLALFFFGFLKKIKVPDIGIGIIALVMSIAGSFIRFIPSDSILGTAFAGTVVGVVMSVEADVYACFPLLNWFIIVVFGYFYGQLLRKCENKDKLYAFATPIAGTIIAVYLAIAIPNELGMMSGNIIDYYQMTTPEMLIIMCGSVFACGLYYFVSKLFSDRAMNFITGLSRNINKTYCIHWVLIGWITTFVWLNEDITFSTWIVAIFALVIYVVSSFLAEVYRKYKDKKKAEKNGTEPQNS